MQIAIFLIPLLGLALGDGVHDDDDFVGFSGGTGYHQPVQTYQEPVVNSYQPVSNYEAPSGYAEPSTSYGQPAQHYGAPTGYEAPSGGYGEPSYHQQSYSGGHDDYGTPLYVYRGRGKGKGFGKGFRNMFRAPFKAMRGAADYMHGFFDDMMYGMRNSFSGFGKGIKGFFNKGGGYSSEEYYDYGGHNGGSYGSHASYGVQPQSSYGAPTYGRVQVSHDTYGFGNPKQSDILYGAGTGGGNGYAGGFHHGRFLGKVSQTGVGGSGYGVQTSGYGGGVDLGYDGSENQEVYAPAPHTAGRSAHSRSFPLLGENDPIPVPVSFPVQPANLVLPLYPQQQRQQRGYK